MMPLILLYIMSDKLIYGMVNKTLQEAYYSCWDATHAATYEFVNR
jgi:hypothetical protein